MRTALVTGANSGLGFETAAQLAQNGYRRIVLACRTLDKAKEAGTALRKRTGMDVFSPLEADLCQLPSVARSVDSLQRAGGSLDALILNAGILPGKSLIRTAEGFEQTSAASLVGHHVLTLGLLRQQLVSQNARVVIAGSEGARGDAPGMKPIDLKAFAAKYFSGDLEAAITSLITMQPPARHHWSTTYCTAKVLVALWANALAPQLPHGITVNAVSPGNVPSTNAVRHQPWLFRKMIGMVSLIGPGLGMASQVSVGARRYLDAIELNERANGGFYASPRGKLVGKLTKQELAPLNDPDASVACWRVLETLTREMAPLRAAAS
jgi:NAD(P)-dependent dehydrogenase (short-subunit alcohol dehydrogenase family)